MNRDSPLAQIENKLSVFPVSLSDEYRLAIDLLRSSMTAAELEQWAAQGLAVAEQGARAWEVALEYFHASPSIIHNYRAATLLEWGELGNTMSQASPPIAIAYLRASASISDVASSHEIISWGKLGQSFYRGTWKSTSLACKFFEITPALLHWLTYHELERFAGFIEALSSRSNDLAQECLSLGKDAFAELEEARGLLISLLTTVVDTSWRDAKGCLEAAIRGLPMLKEKERARLLIIAERLSRSGERGIPKFLMESSTGFAELTPSVQQVVFGLAENLIRLCPPAVPDFIQKSPMILSRINDRDLSIWFDYGVQLLESNREGGIAFFRLESARSQELVNSLSAVVELGRVKELIKLYCRALVGSQVEIAPTKDLVQRGIGWVEAERPTTEGTTVYLPEIEGRYTNKIENFGLIKVIATHQVGHLEYGSFDFEFERPAVHFRNLRPRLSDLQSNASGDALDGDSPLNTDMHRFFAIFPDRRLALDIFTILEDARLDARVLAEYAGLREHYKRVQRDSLPGRPSIQDLPAREALVEVMVRLSLGQESDLVIPRERGDESRAMVRILHLVQAPRATVEDVGEATLRLYAVLSQIPNEDLHNDEWQDFDASEEENEQTEDDEAYDNYLDTLTPQLVAGDETDGEESEQESYDSPQQVDYRGEFKPELVQLINKLKESQDRGDQPDAAETQSLLEQILDDNAELETAQGEPLQNSELAANLMRSAGLKMPPQSSSTGRGSFVHMDENGGPLQRTEANAYLYDEWDFRADDYKPRWCMVREKQVVQGEVTFWNQTLQENASLVTQIRRQFERLVPENFRKVRPLADGEDFDLDAVIDSMIDLRAGGYASDKVYWRRNKVERDVAVLFLLDMSASTAEAIDESRRDDWTAPSDPVEYMLWLRTRRGEVTRRSYKRIIDLEKESIVLLIQALETLGDQYGIYGFSGYGRENVEFYVIKGLEEYLNDSVRRRVDRVSPLHATRMGPAIRHATMLLDKVSAKTKVLFLISDGRPQDRGYSREGVEKEYAVHDTHQALVEARRKNITPFCLTVDRTGHDYLKAMCGDMGYEVLADISSLPQRLPELYKRLTV
jgi:nitric oxide reductase NorD protein